MAINPVGDFVTSAQLPVAAPQGGAAAQPAARPEVQNQAPPRQAAPPDRAQTEQIVMEFKQLVDPIVSNNLNFSVDDSTGKTIVRITDGETGETIRQIPSEEMLEIARSLDKMKGLLLRQVA